MSRKEKRKIKVFRKMRGNFSRLQVSITHILPYEYIGLVSLNDPHPITKLRREIEIYKKDISEARKTITKINLENHNLKLNLLTEKEKNKELEKENKAKENYLRNARERIEELEQDTRYLTGNWTKFKKGKIARLESKLDEVEKTSIRYKTAYKRSEVKRLKSNVVHELVEKKLAEERIMALRDNFSQNIQDPSVASLATK